MKRARLFLLTITCSSLILVASPLMSGCVAEPTAETSTYEAGYSYGYDVGYTEGYDAGLAQSKATAGAAPEIDLPSFSRDEVLAIIDSDENGFKLWLESAENPEDLGYDADSARWFADYLGNGKWEVRLVFTNVEGIWYFYEKSRTVQFWGRLFH